MKKLLLSCLLAFAVLLPAAAYNDFRGHNLDSLERAVARWTPDAIDSASEEELVQLNRAYRDLMLGYQNYNGEKTIFYARKALGISRQFNWHYANMDALRLIGQQFYGREEVDSALFYFKMALAEADLIAGGAASPSDPDGYGQKTIDDAYSALYGAIGNLYNVMGEIPTAMEYYAKAGEIFERNGWNESNAVLYYNIGETMVGENDLKAAEKAYLKSMDYAIVSGDSLMVANAQLGLGHLSLAKGRTWKALRYLHEADEYFSRHDLDHGVTRKDLFEYMSLALREQRKLLGWIIAALVLLAALALGTMLLGRRLRVARKEQTEASAVIEETLSDLQRSAGEEQLVASPREKEILDLQAKGYTTPQIAECLGLSPETVKWYRKKLLVKFDVANSPELVLKAKELGLI